MHTYLKFQLYKWRKLKYTTYQTCSHIIYMVLEMACLSSLKGIPNCNMYVHVQLTKTEAGMSTLATFLALHCGDCAHRFRLQTLQ